MQRTRFQINSLPAGCWFSLDSGVFSLPASLYLLVNALQNAMTCFSFCLPFEVKRNTESKNQCRNTEQSQAGNGAGLFNDYLVRQVDKRDFHHYAHVNELFLHLRFQRLQQLHSDQRSAPA